MSPPFSELKNNPSKKPTWQQIGNQSSLFLPLVSCLAYSTLKMEAICSSETSIDFQRTTRRYIPEDRTTTTCLPNCVSTESGCIAPLFIRLSRGHYIATVVHAPISSLRIIIFSYTRSTKAQLFQTNIYSSPTELCEVRIVVCGGQEELLNRWLVSGVKFVYISSYATSKYFIYLRFVFSCFTR
jgi:hypothetical protein